MKNLNINQMNELAAGYACFDTHGIGNCYPALCFMLGSLSPDVVTRWDTCPA